MGEENDFSAPSLRRKNQNLTLQVSSKKVIKKVIKKVEIIVDKFLWA